MGRAELRFFTTSFPRTPGDAGGGFVAAMAQGLAARGLRVSVEAPHAGHAPPGVSVRAYPGGGALLAGAGAPDALDGGGWRPLLSAVTASAGLMGRAISTRGTHDVAVGHWLVPCGPAALAAGGRCVLYAHGSDVALLEMLPAGPMLARMLDARADRLVFVSRDLAGRFAALLGRPGRAPVSILPMGIAPPAPDSAGLSAWPPAPPGKLRLLTVGRLVPLKGFDVLARALSGRLDVVWIVAGDGPERARLQTMAGELGLDARFLGAVTTGVRDALLSQADLFVLPSRPLGARREGTPVALLEAQAAGLPVVASALGGVPEAACREGVTLVPPDNVEALRAALAPLLDDATRRREAGAANARFATRYAWETLLPQHAEAILGAHRQVQ